MPTNRLWTSVVAMLFFALPIMASADQPLADSTVTLTFNCQDAEPGDVVCVSVEVDNFEDIVSVFLSVNFDPNILSFNSIQNEALALGTASNPGPAEVRYIWVDINVIGVDLPDGTTLFELCFDVIGLPGESTEINLTSNFNQEISNADLEVLPILTEPCTINVLNPNTVGASVTSCGSPDGVADGDFTITIYGGEAPYDYSWVHTTNGAISGMSSIAMSGESETQSVPIGTYDIVVTDNMGAMFMLSVTVLDNLFFYDFVPFDPTCYNLPNGRIAVEATNGIGPYGVIWRHESNDQYMGSAFINPPSTSYNIVSLASGEYFLTITDANGCMAIDSVTLQVDSFMINAVINDATCNGAGDGSITVDISGATPLPGGNYNLTTSWGDNATASMYNSGAVLDPGTHSITISDAQTQCDTVFEFVVGQQFEITANIVVSDVTCAGGMDGEAQITGVPANMYNYQRLDSLGNPDGPLIGNAASVLFTGLTAGNYFVLVDDGSCTSDTIPFTINAPDSIQINVLDVQPTGCIINSMDGAITVEATGGTIGGGSDYVYSWNGGTLMGSSISNLAGGDYMLTVTDDNLCTAEHTINVPEATGPEITDIVATNLSCEGDPITTLEVIFTQGSTPVTTIQWSNGETTAVIISQQAGDTLDVLVGDQNMCFDFFNDYIVPGGSTLAIDSVRLEPPSCPGDSDGQFTVFTSGGTEPLTYIWSTGDTTTFNLLPGLVAGQYSVTVVDADSCGIVDTTVMLNDIETLNFFFTNIDSTGCGLTCEGEATLIPSGGDVGLPYNFFWASGLVETGAQSTATGLCGGWQQVSISQDNICFFTDSVFIPFPDAIVIDTVAFSEVVCSGGDDGFITIDASGGSGSGYQYTWSTLPPGPMQTNLSPGTYYVTVTDSEMCATQDSFTIAQGDSIYLVIDTITTMDVSCAGESDGAIGLQTIGGQPGYSYEWTPNVSDGPLAQNLGPGVYDITVTDQSGCTGTISVEIVEPEPLVSALIDVQPPTCIGESTELGIGMVDGGTGPFTWSINGGQQYPIDSTIQVPVGFYNVIVIDSNQCQDTNEITITGPPAIVLDIFPEDPVVELGDSVLLSLDITNTQGPVDSIAWGHDETGQLGCYDCTSTYAFNLTPTTYFAQVWDSAGCMAVTSVFVDVNNKRNVFIPNAFSPNQDGRNENFAIFTGQGVTLIQSVRVFNRWGELMTEVTNLPPSSDGVVVWNGEFNNKAMMPGVYVYVAEIIFADNLDKPLVYRGDVTLIR